MLRRAAAAWHHAWALTPASAHVYGHLLSLLRPVMPEYAAARLFNFLSAAEWPNTAWPVQHVRVGRHTSIRLVPHPGEFDAEAIVRSHLKYERSVFDWLEPRGRIRRHHRGRRQRGRVHGVLRRVSAERRAV